MILDRLMVNVLQKTEEAWQVAKVEGRDRGGLWIAAFFGFLYHCHLMTGVVGINGDDGTLYASAQLWSLGQANLSDMSIEYAVGQGRFFLVLTTSVAMFQYLLTPELTALTNAIVVLGIAFAFVRLCDLPNWLQTLLVFTLMFCVPIYNSWHGYYHHYLYFKVPILLVLISLLFLRQAISKTTISFGLLCVASVFAIFGILFWELFLVVAVVSSAALFADRLFFSDATWRDRYVTVLVGAAYAVPFFAYLAIYRWFSSAYVGRVSSKLSFNFDAWEIGRTFTTFSLSAFPLNIDHLRNSFWFAGRFSLDWTGPTIALIAIVLLSAWYLLKARDAAYYSDGLKEISKPEFVRSAQRTLSLLLVVFLSANLLYASLGNYQQWIDTMGSWYTPGYLLSLSLACILFVAFALVLRLGIKSSVLMSLFIIGILGLGAVTTIINVPVSQFAKQHSLYLRLNGEAMPALNHLLRQRDTLLVNLTDYNPGRGFVRALQRLNERAPLDVVSSDVPLCDVAACSGAKVESDVLAWGVVSPPQQKPFSFVARVEDPEEGSPMIANIIYVAASSTQLKGHRLVGQTLAGTPIVGRVRFDLENEGGIPVRFREAVQLQSVSTAAPLSKTFSYAN